MVTQDYHKELTLIKIDYITAFPFSYNKIIAVCVTLHTVLFPIKYVQLVHIILRFRSECGENHLDPCHKSDCTKRECAKSNTLDIQIRYMTIVLIYRLFYVFIMISESRRWRCRAYRLYMFPQLESRTVVKVEDRISMIRIRTTYLLIILYS